MKHRDLTATLSLLALLVSSAWGPSAQAVTFTPPPGGKSPSQATGGASRGMVQFTPAPGSAAPKQATGGASRGSLFTPAPGSTAPKQATGGASRGSLFTPAPGRSAPKQTTGGASRGNLFIPAPQRRAPKQTSGGASRGDLFAPAPGNGAPQNAAGGASRVSSYELNATELIGVAGSGALTALIPPNFFGTTLSERPTILVHFPASTATEAIFSLKDEAGNTLYEMALSTVNQVGVIPIQLPADAPALEIGKNYQWFLALNVDGQLAPGTPYVDGWIQRIQPSAALATALQQPDALKRATALGAAGVWYDCVVTLATLRAGATAPDLTNNWTELLTSVGLQDIAQAPVLASTR
jgi:hypothetical protein